MPELPSLELLQQRLDTWRERYHIAGAALGVMLGDDERVVASGVVNNQTGVAATPDSLFQIGSITKVFTTTLIMQLADEGRIDLAAPARKYLPDLRFADERATEAVTVRHLLTHTSGIDGDFFDDFGRGDDCVERYVTACAKLPSLFDPGAKWSYCNAGFVVLGRIIETMTDMPWHRALRERLLDRIGARSMVTLPEEAMRYRTAHGHNIDPSLAVSLTPIWTMARAQAPAGSTPCASVSDLLAFARLHIDGGRARDGTQMLSEASVAAMQKQQFALPDMPGAEAGHWGLGWMLFNWDGRRVVGHDGGTIGQLSTLRVRPEERFAVAGLTNTSPTGGLLNGRAVAWLFQEVLGIETPPRPKPPEEAPKLDLGPYTGTYEKIGTRTTIKLDGGALTVEYVGTGPLPSQQQPPMRLLPVSAELFLQHEPNMNVFQPVVFSEFESGRPRFAFTSFRVSRRID
jgi:CubicO group peptidase (beta-lactamase class C family)